MNLSILLIIIADIVYLLLPFLSATSLPNIFITHHYCHYRCQSRLHFHQDMHLRH